MSNASIIKSYDLLLRTFLYLSIREGFQTGKTRGTDNLVQCCDGGSIGNAKISHTILGVVLIRLVRRSKVLRSLDHDRGRSRRAKCDNEAGKGEQCLQLQFKGHVFDSVFGLPPSSVVGRGRVIVAEKPRGVRV